ncbi:MAG: ABC transporter permease [Bacteriovoracaceae bacterium]
MRSFQYLIRFAFRNLGRAPKRTFVMMLSLSVGLAFIIWDLNFAVSGSSEIMKKFLKQYSGRYHITHIDFYGSDNKKKFDPYKYITDEEIQDKSVIETSTQRVIVPSFLSGEKKTLGVLLTGIDPIQEKKFSHIHKTLSQGRFLDPNAAREIILGKRLAERLGVTLGSELAVIGQATDGSVANDLLTVVGTLDFGGGELEDSLAFTQISSARELMVMNSHQYHQRVAFDMKSEDYPVLKNLAVTSWVDLLPEIGTAVKFIDNFTWIVSIIIVLVVSLGLSNSLMITFLEREQEFQSLTIIGAQNSWITKSLAIEVFLMGTAAVIIGVVLGHCATMYNFYHPINIQIFTGGKDIIMGGMSIAPTVRIYPVYKYYWQAPIMIYFFLSLTMIYPLLKVLSRSRRAI